MIFNFYGSYIDKDKKSFEKAQEEDLKKICKYLETDQDLVRGIKFEVFDTREGKQNADPNHSISRASARFKEMTVYRFWVSTDDPHFPHEITHLVVHTWAKPYFLTEELDTWDNKKVKRTTEMVSTSFMQEGLAIAVDDIVFGRKLPEEGEEKFIDDWCKEQLDKMPTLSECINADGFDSLENKVVVPFAASFSKFLLKKYGVKKYKAMYIKLKETSSVRENIQVIENTYQTKEKDLLKQWEKFLNRPKFL